MPKQHRGHGEGTIYRHKSSGRWVAELYLGMDPEGKKQVWRAYGKTRKQVADDLAKAIAEHNQGKVILTPKTSLADFLWHWLSTHEPTIRPKTFVEYRRYVNAVWIPRLGTAQLGRLTPPEIQQVYADLLREKRSPRWVQMAHATLRAALNDAHKWGTLPGQNPCLVVDVPETPEREYPVWTPEQVRTFLEVMRDDPDEALYIAAIGTGCRAGELLALTWPNVDWQAESITIQRSVSRVDGRGLVVTDGKTKSSRRTIAVSAPVLDALRRQETRAKALRLRAGAGWQECNLVFPSIDGNHKDARSARAKLQRRCKALGLPELRFHDLRHLHASLLIAAGFNSKVIQQRLGHASIQTTLGIYGHLLHGVDRAAADQVGKVL